MCRGRSHRHDKREQKAGSTRSSCYRRSTYVRKSTPKLVHPSYTDLTPPILRQIVNPVQHNRNIRRLIQQRLKMLDRLLLRQIQPELFLYLLVHIAVLDVRDVRVDHEGDEIKNEVRPLAQHGERREAEVLEALVVRGLGAAHAVDHLFADFDWRWERLGVASEDVAEVN